MADNDDATDDDAQAGDDGGTDDQGSSGDAGAQGGSGTGDDLDPKALQAEIRSLRRENAKRRTEAKALQDKLDADEAAKLTESERTAKENERLKAEIAQRDERDRLRDRRAAIEKVAVAKKAIDPDLVAQLLVGTLGEDDEIAPAVEAILKERPYLKGTDATGGDANGSSSASGAAGGSGEESDQERLTRVYGTGTGIFDTKKAIAAGGGVQIPGGPAQVERR